MQQEGTPLNKLLFDGIKDDIDSKLATSSKATQTEAEGGSNNTKYMTPLRVLQEVNALALPSKQMSIKTGTISDDGIIPQTSGYSNYLYIVTPSSPTNNFDASHGHPNNFAGFRMFCSVNQETRVVTSYTQGFYYSSGSSNGWENKTTFTADYYEIAWN